MQLLTSEVSADYYTIILIVIQPEKVISLFTLLGSGVYHHHHHHQSIDGEGHSGAIDGFTTSFRHFPLFSTALWDLPNSRPVRSLMLSSRLITR